MAFDLISGLLGKETSALLFVKKIICIKFVPWGNCHEKKISDLQHVLFHIGCLLEIR